MRKRDSRIFSREKKNIPLRPSHIESLSKKVKQEHREGFCLSNKHFGFYKLDFN
ncbi:hypothetical protein LEP1GSC125_3716 [Leptospira mayottensis 200901122]|uniref:Uncharacterized protein n=1 Tax=Leptospira mayottensis 200901122 TaxID=1193010 RepID=A0AA87SWI3_9LEPT|nr:hypothetical protein LEP1GSC125_3716 [Leptospira mayottensis 200901122]